ncbi:hypothetical protein [Bacillus toyonensis]|uniref:Uncharacterized protein n=1 Tax=Bacillus toyonensis TaxID=155322 RepID=A0A2B5X3T1_9BACI|nr:hypothetical protein [Bacillus toyonensis]PGA91034.1 hypothetical protein COL93_27635 [Bacillus toyonensis]PHD67095.1 hypothetical protein COF40_20145 [Bacillus toyonensis]
MRVKKEMLKQWKADLQAIQEEKRRKKREKKKNGKYNISGHTADFMNREDTYYKKNGVWKQKKK